VMMMAVRVGRIVDLVVESPSAGERILDQFDVLIQGP
jgi:hypothetical protein